MGESRLPIRSKSRNYTGKMHIRWVVFAIGFVSWLLIAEALERAGLSQWRIPLLVVLLVGLFLFSRSGRPTTQVNSSDKNTGPDGS